MIITLDDLLGINNYICLDCNQISVVINEANLLSALGTQQWYSNDCLRAAALIRSLVIGHGFQDGNKRTAAAAGQGICEYECSEDEVIECILNIAKGQLRESETIAKILYPISYK